jgi:putative ABC transport system substrate-binding protein
MMITELASLYRLPSISATVEFPKEGGLMYYGTSVILIDTFRQAAGYVDRILKGANPGDLPIQLTGTPL